MSRATPAWAERHWGPLVSTLCTQLEVNDEDKVDEALAAVYNNKYLDSTPQDVKDEVHGIGRKWRLHGMEKEASRLLELAEVCDYNLTKLLLEVTEPATEDLIFHENNYEEVEEEINSSETEEDRLKNELVAIAVDEEWRNAWNEEDDMDDWSEWSDVSGEPTLYPINEDSFSSHEGDMDSIDEYLSDADERDQEQELKVAYPAYSSGLTENSYEIEEMSITRSDHPPFALDEPNDLNIQVTRTLSFSKAPTKVLAERDVVLAVFSALNGIPTTPIAFERSSDTMFEGDFTMTSVYLCDTVGLSHLSSGSLSSLLNFFLPPISSFQFLRDFTNLSRTHTLHNDSKSVVWEGLGHTLQQMATTIQSQIHVLQREMLDEEEDSENVLLPTLLGARIHLRPAFRFVVWLQATIHHVFQSLSKQNLTEIEATVVDKTIVDELYTALKMSGSQSSDLEGEWNDYNVLLDLFQGSLEPFLEMLDRLCFDLRVEIFQNADENDSLLAKRTEMYKDRQGVERASSGDYEMQTEHLPKVMSEVGSTLKEAFGNKSLLHTMHVYESNAYQSTLKSSFASVVTHCRYSGMRTPVTIMMQKALLAPIQSISSGLHATIVHRFLHELGYADYLDALRTFVLFQQQDVLSLFSRRLLQEIASPTARWAKSEMLDAIYHDIILDVEAERNVMSDTQEKIAEEIALRVDVTKMVQQTKSIESDVGAFECLHFTVASTPSLRTLLGPEVMQKYSCLSVQLLQVKAVEASLVQFQHSLRRRRCFAILTKQVQKPLAIVHEMLHFVKSLLTYLRSQIDHPSWQQTLDKIHHASSLAAMDEEHNAYLNRLLCDSFLLDKHEQLRRHILGPLNRSLHFLRVCDTYLDALDRHCDVEASDVHASWWKDAREVDAIGNDFSRQARFLVGILASMESTGAVAGVSELVQQLNYNDFYTRPHTR